MEVGIEAINAYGGQAFIDVRELFEKRGLDMGRFENLMMQKKSVGLPCEDPVTFAVNAAKPIVDALTKDDCSRIELVITSTESGLDFGKSLSTYIHDYLKLSRNVRLFEIKQACYGGTAAFQMAANFIVSGASPGAKALVVATDIARAAAKGTYGEPSQGVAAVAMLVSDAPHILKLDHGASGYYGYEVMDTCRPLPELETGDPDLSVLAYLECVEATFRAYCERVEGADYASTFDYLGFHTPFAGMVKGAHRNAMRKFKKAPAAEIDSDFQRRVAPSLRYCVEVGNVYSATLYLALCGLIDHAPLNRPSRVGMFSYGSGCASEFYSGIITPESRRRLAAMHIAERLAERQYLDIDHYDRILDLNMEWIFGVQNKKVDHTPYRDLYDRQFAGRGLLVLKEVKGFHRTYEWS
ncbi:MAG TPA: hydroxymethylglutaryl-CoA synthase [Acidobacteriaceae bacterium]|jgi:polyketide biosynthesis 3-hydroxy-3-methylglutaryl-CoA synthase-like enzyme PksG|nr:hydroxymethylglutaryl-CoA synthase [Acidobacteriaceae bacterium]